MAGELRKRKHECRADRKARLIREGHTILGIEEIVQLLRDQADVRALENDEAGCLEDAAGKLEYDVFQIEGMDEDELHSHRLWKAIQGRI